MNNTLIGIKHSILILLAALTLNGCGNKANSETQEKINDLENKAWEKKLEIAVLEDKTESYKLMTAIMQHEEAQKEWKDAKLKQRGDAIENCGIPECPHRPSGYWLSAPLTP